MVLNRKTDRRRRLLVDSNSLVGGTGEVDVKNKKKPASKAPVQADVRKAYAVGAKRRHQRKVTDFIPKRRLAYSLTVAVFAFILAGVNLLAYFAPSWHGVIGAEGLTALAVTGPSSLTTFVATICFSIAAVLCFQIYALRQHRCDDYEGTYRVWGWLAPVFAIASLACVLPLTAISQNIFMAVSGRGFTVTWVPLVVGVGFASLFLIRYVMEVRYSYGTVAWSGLAWLAICTSWASPEIMKAFSPNVDQRFANDLASGNGLLIAAAASLLANLTYARFVFLRSNGFIQAKPKQIKSKAAFPFRPFRDRTDERRSRANRKAAAVVEKEAATAEKLVAKQTKKADRKASAELRTAGKTKKAKRAKATKATPPAKRATATVTASAPAPVAKPKPVKVTPAVGVPVAASQQDEPAKQVSISASERLKQLAAATRIQKTPDLTGDQESPSTIKMSKAQRKKLRKQQRNQNRAA